MVYNKIDFDSSLTSNACPYLDTELLVRLNLLSFLARIRIIGGSARSMVSARSFVKSNPLAWLSRIFTVTTEQQLNTYGNTYGNLSRIHHTRRFHHAAIPQ